MSVIREIIASALKAHPPECIFEENALEKIVAEVEGKVSDLSPAGDMLDAMEAAIRRREIYCPHEGIGV